MKTGVFVGSFNPFTIGHESIVRRSLALFDKLVIGVGVNTAKEDNEGESRVGQIALLYADEPRVEVRSYTDLTVDFARREGDSSS